MRVSQGWHYLAGTLGIIASARGAQEVLKEFLPSSLAVYDEGLFNPVEDLSSLSALEYTTLRHPNFLAHSVRIKQSRFCDGEATAYTGYIDVEARHLFFYFFESRRDPDSDDVIFWTNGGPGGSSAMGLFMEIGPCRVTSANSTERFEYAWNSHANVFFIDQPVGAGFSYVDYGEQVSTTVEAAQDIAAFVAIFFERFPKFKGRPFHMAGESYGGRSVPVFASAVYDQNTKLVAAGMTPINLTSVMLGNGCTDYAGMLLSYYEIQCKAYGGYPFVASISECVRMRQLLPRCEQRLQKSCRDVLDRIDCGEAWSFCWNAFPAAFMKVNAHDALRPCTGHTDMESCYPITKHLREYLNNPSVQASLGVDPPHRNFTLVNEDVYQRFSEDRWDFRSEHYLAALLERGVRALVYVGATDWLCNWVGTERMTLGLEWSSQEAFRSQPLREWKVDGEVAGKMRSAGGLTFATIDAAGHMAPYDQPVRSLYLANAWLAGEEL
ncbi:serine carboxypeptidase [Earliella scabrosa]|nr:serine carboxypeptidase [Earliella scabrosa]